MATAMPALYGDSLGGADRRVGAGSGLRGRLRLEAALALLALGRRQLARDDLRDAVAAHAHAVEAVGGVHRPLLVRHDYELGPIGVAPHELEEAVDVRVVERGLDLVEDV